MTASVLKTAVFNSAGSKSSTNSFKFCFNSKDIDDLFSFNSSADFGSEYLLFSSSKALSTKCKSVLVISEKFYIATGLPFRYKMASIFVISLMLSTFF